MNRLAGLAALANGRRQPARGAAGSGHAEVTVKQRSKAKHTMFGGYCNGVLAYMPTAETVARGGMSVESAVRTYNIPAPPVAETVDIVVGEYGKLLCEVGI